ncbi:hypothetical protein BD408DRAFT_385095 [Parasitella parasitica]|nr:hypothetical protein BD408DRAFT_385095 [Parasitella parasitica]
MNPKALPATCELCGDWLPRHSAECPREGVHPSQWKDIQFEEKLDAIDISDNEDILNNEHLFDTDQVAMHSIYTNTHHSFYISNLSRHIDNL